MFSYAFLYVVFMDNALAVAYWQRSFLELASQSQLYQITSIALMTIVYHVGAAVLRLEAPQLNQRERGNPIIALGDLVFSCVFT